MKHSTTAWAMTAGAAALALLGTKPQSAWYQRLDKPDWQPPAIAFPLFWTPLYGLIGWAGGRALTAAARDGQADKYLAMFGADLALNAGWCWAFFTAKSPAAGLATIAALDLANAELLRATWQLDRAAGKALLPYVAWTGFATALNAAIWRRNRRS